MRKVITLVVVGLVGAGAFWQLTAPKPLPASAFAGVAGDATRGEGVFWAAGCASCHMAPNVTGDAELVLSGGQKFPSPFGVFVAPNISPDPTEGIGGWTLPDFANAVMRGISPQGAHYFPVFPYTAYGKASYQDIADLKSFLDTLPADTTPSQPHEVGFPFNIRRSLGGWKLLFGGKDWGLIGDLSTQETRGRYLAEALAHCAECHTPRKALGGLDHARWMAGGPNPTGKGTIPNITPGKLDWSEDEIVEYLTSGFTPDYDSVGGLMAHVVSNLARLPESDRRAIAAYVKRLPAVN